MCVRVRAWVACLCVCVDACAFVQVYAGTCVRVRACACVWLCSPWVHWARLCTCSIGRVCTEVVVAGRSTCVRVLKRRVCMRARQAAVVAGHHMCSRTHMLCACVCVGLWRHTHVRSAVLRLAHVAVCDTARLLRGGAAFCLGNQLDGVGVFSVEVF